MKTSVPRIAWIAGTRGEVLQLGPPYRRFQEKWRKIERAGLLQHRFIYTSEQGTAGHQALDFLGIAPHAAFELLSPGDDSGVRLQRLLDGLEKELRQHRTSHAIFAGCSASSVAAGLICHSRPCQGIWLKPFDPAELIDRFQWESGNMRILQSLQPTVTSIPSWHCTAEAARPFIENRNIEIEKAPSVLILLGRRLWGMRGDFGHFARAIGEWARRFREVQWVVITALDQRLDSPLRTMKDRPPNLVQLAPLPFDAFDSLLANCLAVVTDSHSLASDAVVQGIPSIAVGEMESRTEGRPGLLHLVPQDLKEEFVQAFLEDSIARGAQGPARATQTEPDAFEALIDKILGSVELS